MSLKKVLTFALALFITGGGLQAQKLIVGADFTTRFDNREYANNDFNESQTLFSARLTPRIGVEWMDKNRLIVGVDLLQNFGDDTKFLSKARPSAYYQFNSRNVQANAGIFDRKELLGDYSLAFFGDSTAFYHNRLSGFLGHYKSTERRNTYVEMAIDWEGMFEQAIDPEKARNYFESRPPKDRHTCTMCGKMCAMRTSNKILNGESVTFCDDSADSAAK